MDKIDLILEHISGIRVDISEIRKDLEYHIRRTDLLEEQVKPIARHVTVVQGVGTLLGIIAVITGILVSVGVL